MKTRKIEIPAVDYTYPTLAERNEAVVRCPKLDCFKFEYQHEIESIHDKGLDMDEASRRSNLWNWNICLRNRFGKIASSYINMRSHFERGFHDDYFNCHKGEHINYIQFWYYAEVFHYFFVSSQDILGQLLNCYYKIDLKENNVKFNKGFFKKIKEIEVRNELDSYFEKSSPFRDLRNAFAHRFTPNQADYRSIIEKADGTRKLLIRGGNFTPSGKIIEISEDAMMSLSYLMQKLMLKIPSD